MWWNIRWVTGIWYMWSLLSWSFLPERTRKAAMEGKVWSWGRQRKSQKTQIELQSGPRTSLIFVSFCLLLQGDSGWFFFYYGLRGYKMEKNKKKKNVCLCAGMCLCSCVWMDKCVSVGTCAHGRQQSALDVMSQEPSTSLFETGAS